MKEQKSGTSETSAQFKASFSFEDFLFAVPQACLMDGHSFSGRDGDMRGAVSTDSRTVASGEWYLALKGERFDGHRFIADAIARGAMGIVVSDNLEQCWEILDKQPSLFVIEVPDTLKAYQAIATHHLHRVNPKVVAITGSSGKTTTKEMCASIFSAAYNVHKSPANENNEIGLPKTILAMPEYTEVLVAEMAMRGLGQINDLANIAAPHIGIITNAGTAHIELLGSEENIAKAKCELLSHLDSERGLALIGNPSEHLVAIARSVFNGPMSVCTNDQIEEKDVSFATTEFTIKGIDQNFIIHAHGQAHLQDAWCAVLAAMQLGMTKESIALGLFSYHSIDGRGNCVVADNGAIIIDESYNANPESMRCAVAAMLDSRVFPQSKKVVVLGDMGELGERTDALHLELGQWLKDKHISALITVGKHSQRISDGAQGGSFSIKHVSSNDEVAKAIKEELDEHSCVIVKGSHSAQLETVVADLVAS